MKDTNNTTRPPAPASGAEFNLLREIREELRKLREAVGELQTRILNATPVQTARAVSIDAAQTILGCGRSQIFALLKSGALRRAPKVGKAAFITLASIEALHECINREPAPKLKRQPAQQKTGQAEKEAILKLIRQA